MSKKEARPGQEVDITIISKPNSYIGLLGVDQSVLLLRKGNDLDKSQIFNELNEYSRKQSAPSRYYGVDEWQDFAVSFDSNMPKIDSNYHSFSILQNSGAILLTNARPTENRKICFSNFKMAFELYFLMNLYTIRNR